MVQAGASDDALLTNPPGWGLDQFGFQAIAGKVIPNTQTPICAPEKLAAA